MITTLPQAARAYLYLIWATASVAIVMTLLQSGLAPMPILPLIVCSVAYILADYFEVPFGINSRDRVAMTVVDAPTIFMVPILGSPGVLVVLVGTLVVDMLRQRSWFKGLFNATQRSITYLAILGAYGLIMPAGAPPFDGLRGLLAFGAVAVIYYTVNTILVSTILALAIGRPLLSIYIDSFRKVYWVHFISLPFGATLAYIWSSNPWLTVAAALPLVMAYSSFKAMAGWQEESARSQALAEQATGLVEELRAKQEEIIRSTQLAALGTFAASVAHEFNNLLTAILGFAQMGYSATSVSDKNDALQVAIRACERGQSITGGLLTFARRRDPRREPCEIDSLIEDTVTLLRPEFAKVNVQLVADLSPLPTIICDGGQISQVLINLMSNARDAMIDRGGGQITISAAAHAEQLELRVHDTGSGIPPEMLSKIFQPFITTKHGDVGGRPAGTGLGLAICQAIVESHGGTIVVESTLGVGTTMTVRLPLLAELALPLGSREVNGETRANSLV